MSKKNLQTLLLLAVASFACTQASYANPIECPKLGTFTAMSGSQKFVLTADPSKIKLIGVAIRTKGKEQHMLSCRYGEGENVAFTTISYTEKKCTAEKDGFWCK